MTKNKGFTLLEVVIAVGILIIVGGIGVAASTRAINTQTFSKNRLRAQELARNQIERLKVMRDSDYIDDLSFTEWDRRLDACLRYVYGADYFQVGRAATGFIGIDTLAGEQDPTSSGRVSFYLPKCEAGKNGAGGVRDWVDSPRYKIQTVVEIVPDNFNGNNNGVVSPTDYIDESKNLRRVTVTVTWEEPFLAGEQQIKLVSYLTNNKTNN